MWTERKKKKFTATTVFQISWAKKNRDEISLFGKYEKSVPKPFQNLKKIEREKLYAQYNQVECKIMCKFM